MVADLNRLLVGLLLVIVVCSSFILKLDIFLLSIILFLIIFDFYKLNLIKNTTQIVILIFTISIAYLNFKFEIFLTNLYLLQIILIISTILVKKHRFVLFYISIIIFCIIVFSIILNDRYFFYLIIGISFFNDTIAYIFGSKIKGPLIFPKISPKKTWSGTITSFILSTTALFFLNFDLLFSALISISLFLGDIYFSFIKRSLNIKDFSSSLGHHGGILDRLDSMFFISIFFQLYLLLNI